MTWITPKVDWNAADYYNFGALNRVENNTDALADLIATYAARPGVIAVLTTRTMTSIEFFDSLNRIEGNLLILANASYIPPGWVAPVLNWASVAMAFSFVDANRLEVNLQALYTLINNLINYFQYCGTFTCGQDNTYL